MSLKPDEVCSVNQENEKKPQARKRYLRASCDKGLEFIRLDLAQQ